MKTRVVFVLRGVAALVLAVLVLADTQAAYAQGGSCSQVSGTLSALERNSNFRNLQRNIDRARQLGARLRDAESVFVRSGCQRVLNSGRRLSGDCRALASEILKGRENYNQLSASIETGQAVAQQREAVLQQMARFGCNSRSSAGFNQQPRRDRSPFQDFLDRVFGNQGRIVDDPYGSPYYNQSTIRTVCVRSCDGYYWPISFATVEDYLGNDAAMCQQQCPGEAVELYYYRNPGESPEQMVSMSGQSYSSLPNAFRYRKEYDASCSCKTPKSYGQIEFTADNGQVRASTSIGDLTFPLPLRDPRATSQPVTIVQAIQVPLPRPRPPLEGDPQAVVMASASADSPDPGLRVVMSGDRRVRIVGPDTPYARSMAKGL